MNKKCYGLDIPAKGKMHYIYEDPYTYIEKLNCKPIDDFVGYMYGTYNDDFPVRDPIYINSTRVGYNIMFYSEDGLSEWRDKEFFNPLAGAFCDVYKFGMDENTPLTDRTEIYESMIILPSDRKTLTTKDKKKLKELLKNLDGYMQSNSADGMEDK